MSGLPLDNISYITLNAEDVCMRSINYFHSVCFMNIDTIMTKIHRFKRNRVQVCNVCRFFLVPFVSTKVRFDTISLIMMAKCVYFQQIHMLPSTGGPPKHAVLSTMTSMHDINLAINHQWHCFRCVLLLSTSLPCWMPKRIAEITMAATACQA